MFVFDCETYRNYFLFAAKMIGSDKTVLVEMHNDQLSDPKGRELMLKIMSKYVSVSFNGNNYDLAIMVAFLQGYTNSQLKDLSDDIILKPDPTWKICKDRKIHIPKSWDHIDLFEVSPGKASLKIYGGRLGAPKMQDLPIEPDHIISDDNAQVLRDYCGNDLDVTERLHQALVKQIDLRVEMSKEYGMDLRSKSDAQIAETVIKSEYKKVTGDTAYKPDISLDEFYYKPPAFVKYRSKYMQDILQHIIDTPFEIGGNGAVQLPQWLKKERIMLDDVPYQMGIGGLHSCEKKQLVLAGDKILCDMDVASYYPNIILEQQLAPPSMGKHFIDVYQSIVKRRIAAKRAGDKVTADTLKICVNGSFGKLGSKYSALYAPELLIQTTVTGQLALLMLIERMVEAGIKVVSANTDGIVLHCDKDLEGEMEQVAFDWMMDTTFELERTDYKCLASRDVNNYVAVKTNGSHKGKGVFAGTGLMKNPDMPIIPKAVSLYHAHGTAIEDTIRGCDDILQFCSIRRVNGGGQWQGEYLGKAVRFYWSSEFDEDVCIQYVKNTNKVPKSAGCRPLMDIKEVTDIDFDRYIEAANKLLEETGVKR